jgi:succinoglycan biosynthesis transport protein ExoP
MNYSIHSAPTQNISNLDNSAPNIHDLIAIFWHRRKEMVLVAGLITLAGLAFVLTKPTYYNASTTIVINDSQLKLNNFNDLTEGGRFTDFTVQTEVRILNSSSLATQTIKAVGLEKTSEYKGYADDPRQILTLFANNLNIRPQGSSRVIEISFRAQDPELAAQVANAHAKAYLESQVYNKNDRVLELEKWFENRVNELKKDVVKKSEAVSQFRQQSNLPSDALLDVVQAPYINELKVRENEVLSTLRGLQSRYGPRHPDVQKAQDQLDSIRATIDYEVSNVVGEENSALPNDQLSYGDIGLSDSAGAVKLSETDATPQSISPETINPVSETEIEFSAASPNIDNIQLNLVTLKGLILEQQASQKLLDSFLANYENIQSQNNFARPDAVLASEAITPLFPTQPGKKILMIVVFAFAGLAAFATAIVLELLRGGIQSFADIRKLKQNPVGVLPDVSTPLQLILSPMNSSFKEAVKQIYMTGLMDSKAKTILISSAMPKEGRTMFAKLLGYYLSGMGRKVVIVDCDFLKPDFNLMNPSQSALGLTDVLSGHHPLNAVIQQDQHGLSIIKSGTPTDALPNLLEANNFKTVLNDLKKMFEYVIIDSGPLLARNESSIVAKHVDGIIVLTEWAKTSERNVINMLRILEPVQDKVLGFVINRINIEKYKNMTSGNDFLLPKIKAKSGLKKVS